MKRILSIGLCAVFAVTALSACGTLRERFGSKSDAYKNSEQAPALEVPPGLDAPNRSGALTIPEPSATASNLKTDGSVPAASFKPSSAPPIETMNLAGGDLQLADSLDHTWTRVGIALERSGVATIQSRDAVQRTYEISTTGEKTRSPGFLKKVVTLGMAGDKSVKTPVGLRVRVSGSDGASKVTVEGATTESGSNAAQRILKTLRQRMT